MNISSSLLYFATLSPLAGAPLFIKSAPTATDKSAINVSSAVSPLLWDTHICMFASCASFINSSVSVNVPIWFGFTMAQVLEGL